MEDNKRFVLHQLASQSRSQMMSYVLECGSEICVIDGGKRADALYLADYVAKLRGGAFKTELWILTHAHSDHIEAFFEIAKRQELLAGIGEVVYSFPRLEYFAKYTPADYDTPLEFYSLLPRLGSRASVASAGFKRSVGGAEIEIIFVPDEKKYTENFINNHSLVTRVTANGKTLLFTGDLGREAGRELTSLAGSGLKTDYIQMAHHGQQGVDFDFYRTAAPEACLWDTPRWLWVNDAGKGPGTGPWKTLETREWTERLKITRHYITMNGTNVIEI